MHTKLQASSIVVYGYRAIYKCSPPPPYRRRSSSLCECVIMKYEIFSAVILYKDNISVTLKFFFLLQLSCITCKSCIGRAVINMKIGQGFSFNMEWKIKTIHLSFSLYTCRLKAGIVIIPLFRLRCVLHRTMGSDKEDV